MVIVFALGSAFLIGLTYVMGKDNPNRVPMK